MRPGQVRGANSAVLLELLQRHERLSRADLARYSGLSEGTVSRIVTELIRRKLVIEDGAENSTGGRPAICLRLEQNRFAVGVDVHSWETQFGVGTMRGRIVETGHPPPMATRPRKRLLRQLLGPLRITDHQPHAAHDLAVVPAEEILERQPHVSIKTYEPGRTAKV